jgi:hypothetical protein
VLKATNNSKVFGIKKIKGHKKENQNRLKLSMSEGGEPYSFNNNDMI